MGVEVRSATRKVTKELRVDGHPSLSLGDLRWLVAQAEDLPDSALVEPVEHKTFAANEWQDASVIVRGDVIEEGVTG